MSNWHFYVDVDGEPLTCDDIVTARHAAIDHLRRTSDDTVTIYTSHTKKHVVGILRAESGRWTWATETRPWDVTTVSWDGKIKHPRNQS